MPKDKYRDRTTADSRAPKNPIPKRRRTDAALANIEASSYKGGNQRAVLVTEAPSTKRVKIEPAESLTETNRVDAKREVGDKVYNDIVYLKIGPAATKFGIHRGLLTKYSSFFKKILEPGYVSDSNDVAVALEEDSTVVNLPDDDPEIFFRVNFWFYSQDFRYEDEAWKDVNWQHLINVYVFAVQKGIVILHNTCIDSTVTKVQDGGLFPGQSTINALWKHAVNVTPLRSLFVTLFATHCNLKSAILANRAYHPTFLNLLVIEMYEMQSKGIRPEEVDVEKKTTEYWMHGPENPIAVE